MQKKIKLKDISIILFIIYLFHLVFMTFFNNIIEIKNNKIFEYAYTFKIYRWLFNLPIIYYFLKNIKNYDYFKINNKLDLKDFIIYFAIFFLGSHILNCFTLITGNFKERQSGIYGSLYMDIIWVVCISPILEEIIFRGVIMNNLKKYGIRIAIIINSILFAASHYDVNKIITAFFMGIIFSYIANKYSMKYSILIHFFLNMLGIVPVIIVAFKVEEFLYIYGLFFIILSVFLLVILIFAIRNKNYKGIFSIFKLNNKDRGNMLLFFKNNLFYLLVIIGIVISNLLFNYKLF